MNVSREIALDTLVRVIRFVVTAVVGTCICDHIPDKVLREQFICFTGKWI